MKLLSIDTCTEVCSVSLSADNVQYNRFVHSQEKSSGLILPLCDALFSEAGISLSALDGIIYSKGPGAFTGVRMCIGVVQGLSLAHNIPTLGFSTLEVMAVGACEKYQTDKVAVALDARMNQVYWGVYQQQHLGNERLEDPDKVCVLGDDFIGVGTGWGSYGAQLSAQSGVMQYHADFYPQANNLIKLALSYLKQGKGLKNNLPMPTYLRNNVAIKSLK